jgi:hypothetical protein
MLLIAMIKALAVSKFVRPKNSLQAGKVANDYHAIARRRCATDLHTKVSAPIDFVYNVDVPVLFTNSLKIVIAVNRAARAGKDSDRPGALEIHIATYVVWTVNF